MNTLDNVESVTDITSSVPLRFIILIGLLYLCTLNSFNSVLLTIPFLVKLVIYLSSSKLYTGIELITFSSGLKLIILLICLPSSFHFTSGISYTGKYK